MSNKKKYSLVFLLFMMGLTLVGGLLIGMVLQQQLLYLGLAEIAEGLEGTNFEINIDINETLIVDRTMEHMENVLEQMNQTDNLTGHHNHERKKNRRNKRRSK